MLSAQVGDNVSLTAWFRASQKLLWWKRGGDVVGGGSEEVARTRRGASFLDEVSTSAPAPSITVQYHSSHSSYRAYHCSPYNPPSLLNFIRLVIVGRAPASCLHSPPSFTFRTSRSKTSRPTLTTARTPRAETSAP